MIEKDYETYKEIYFSVFPNSSLEDMAKETHRWLVAYEERIILHIIEGIAYSSESEDGNEFEEILSQLDPHVSEYIRETQSE